MFSSSVPTLIMTVTTANDPSPRKRRKIMYPIEENTPIKDSENNIFTKASQCSFSFTSALIFADLSRDCDVIFYIGFPDANFPTNI